MFSQIDPALCAVLVAALHDHGPTPTGPVHVDHEGDTFFDFDGNGTISEDEMFWDCPVYVGEAGETPGSIIDN